MKYIKSFSHLQAGMALELLFWVIALVLLATTNVQQHHFTLCPLANLGFEDWCPGCGLGRSISHVFHGQLTQSFKEHWFGLPALIIILYRVYTLIMKKEDKILTRNT